MPCGGTVVRGRSVSGAFAFMSLQLGHNGTIRRSHFSTLDIVGQFVSFFLSLLLVQNIVGTLFLKIILAQIVNHVSGALPTSYPGSLLDA